MAKCSRRPAGACVMWLCPGPPSYSFATFASLMVTSAAQLAAHQLKDAESEFWQAPAADLLMLHGGAAMIALMLLGALIPAHLKRSWRAGRNRITGTAMAATNAILVVTTFGLYYAGSDVLRMGVA